MDKTTVFLVHHGLNDPASPIAYGDSRSRQEQAKLVTSSEELRLAAGAEIFDAQQGCFVLTAEEFDGDAEDAQEILLSAFTKRLCPPAAAASILVALGIHPIYGLAVAGRAGATSSQLLDSDVLVASKPESDVAISCGKEKFLLLFVSTASPTQGPLRKGWRVEQAFEVSLLAGRSAYRWRSLFHGDDLSGFRAGWRLRWCSTHFLFRPELHFVAKFVVSFRAGSLEVAILQWLTRSSDASLLSHGRASALSLGRTEVRDLE